MLSPFPIQLNAMTAPLINQLFPGLVTGGRSLREIDNHYHVQSIAESARQLVDYRAALFEQQHQTAIENLRALEDVASEQRESNSFLSQLVDETARIGKSLDDVLHVLRNGFATVAALMIQQRQKLDEIADLLRQPFGTQAIELLAEAERALDSGMKRTGPGPAGRLERRNAPIRRSSQESNREPQLRRLVSFGLAAMETL